MILKNKTSKPPTRHPLSGLLALAHLLHPLHRYSGLLHYQEWMTPWYFFFRIARCARENKNIPSAAVRKSDPEIGMGFAFDLHFHHRPSFTATTPELARHFLLSSKNLIRARPMPTACIHCLPFGQKTTCTVGPRLSGHLLSGYLYYPAMILQYILSIFN